MMKLLVLIAVVVFVVDDVAADRAFRFGSRPYIIADADQRGEVYAKSAAGRTRIFLVGEKQDKLLDEYDWAEPRWPKRTLVQTVGWRKGRKVVLVVRPNNRRAPDADPKKQVELRLYLNGEIIRSLTTSELVNLGARLQRATGDGRHGFDKGVVYAEYHCQGFDGYRRVETNPLGFISFRFSKERIVLVGVEDGRIIRNPYP